MSQQKKTVNAPKIVTTVNAKGDPSKRGPDLIIKNTPAVTIVAACIKAETGVGPSIASGSQVCNPSCADFPTAPINNNIQIIVIFSLLATGLTIKLCTVEKSKAPNSLKIINIANTNPRSPTLFINIAFIAS